MSISSEAAVSPTVAAPAKSRNSQSNYEPNQLPKFIYLPELSSEKVGSKVLYSTDDHDDGTKNLLKAAAPVWNDDSVLNNQLDGWETVANKSQNCQWCIIQLGVPGVIYGVDVDTAYFIGHHALKMSIQGAKLNTEDLSKAQNKSSKLSEWSSSDDWAELVPSNALQPGYQTCSHNYFKVSNRETWTHIRFSIFPGGGVARLHVYGQPVANMSSIPSDSLTDLLLLQNGGACVCSSSSQMIQLASTLNYDNQKKETNGWMKSMENHLLPILDLGNLKDMELESFWAVFRLGHSGIIKKIEIETGKFDCNYLSFCRLEACSVKKNLNNDGFEEEADQYPWYTLLPLTGLLPCTRSVYEITPPRHGGVVTHIRLSIGLAVPAPVKRKLLQSTLKRLHIWGYNCLPSFPKL